MLESIREIGSDVSTALISFFLIFWAISVVIRGTKAKTDREALGLMIFGFILGTLGMLIAGYWVG